MTRARGQANLAALAVALVALVAATTLGLVVADGALSDAQRDSLTRRAATAAADRLVTAEVTTVRPNVLDDAALPSLTANRLDGLAPPVEGRDVRVQLGDDVLIHRGDPTGGVTVRRVVLVAEETTRTRSVAVANDSSVTLPRRSTRATFDFSTAAGIETVRANDRVVLHDPDGLSGTRTVRLSRYETTTLTFSGGAGTVAVTYYPRETHKATLAVTVDD